MTKHRTTFILLLCPPLLLACGQASIETITAERAGDHVTKIGTVTQVASRSVIRTTADGQSLVLKLSPHVLVWKGRDYRDFSPIRVGDEIMVTGDIDKDGNIAVSKLWDSIVHLAGTIVRFSGSEIYIETLLTESHPKQTILISIDENTRFFDSDSVDLRAGRGIDVIGVQVSKKRVQASKVVIYIGDRPARLGPQVPILPPT